MVPSGEVGLASATATDVAAVRIVAVEPLWRVALLGFGFALLASVSASARFAPRAAELCLVLVVLAVGLVLVQGRRAAAAPLLLFGVPSAGALGAAFSRGAPVDPVVVSVLALLLVAYLVESSRLVAIGSGPALGAERERPRAPRAPPRIERRRRMFDALTVLAGLAFAWPLGWALFGGARPTVLIVATAGLLGTLACRAFVIDPLERHLLRDPALVASLARLRKHARRGRPVPVFYAAAGAALVAMAILVARRFLGLDAGGAP